MPRKKSSLYKMKYQGNNSAFPFKSPLKQGEKELPTTTSDTTKEASLIRVADAIGKQFTPDSTSVESMKQSIKHFKTKSSKPSGSGKSSKIRMRDIFESEFE